MKWFKANGFGYIATYGWLVSQQFECIKYPQSLSMLHATYCFKIYKGWAQSQPSQTQVNHTAF